MIDATTSMTQMFDQVSGGDMLITQADYDAFVSDVADAPTFAQFTEMANGDAAEGLTLDQFLTLTESEEALIQNFLTTMMRGNHLTPEAALAHADSDAATAVEGEADAHPVVGGVDEGGAEGESAANQDDALNVIEEKEKKRGKEGEGIAKAQEKPLTLEEILLFFDLDGDGQISEEEYNLFLGNGNAGAVVDAANSSEKE